MAHYPPKERVFTKNWSLPRSWTLDAYKSTGGYRSLEKALTMAPDAIIKEVIDANIRGRGGAGFPVGRKWSFVPKDSPKPRYLCVNADESEPGTFKDRYILERDPHHLCRVDDTGLEHVDEALCLRIESEASATCLDDLSRDDGAVDPGILGDLAQRRL